MFLEQFINIPESTYIFKLVLEIVCVVAVLDNHGNFIAALKVLV